MNFIANLSNKMNDLNKTEQRILSYCLEHSLEMERYKIVDLAAELFVSPNTIIRLAKKLGYNGFSEFKYAIHNSLVKQEVIKNDMHDIIEALEKTAKLLQPEILQQVVNDIKCAPKVCIFASGISRYAAMPFVKKMQYLNRLVLLSDDQDSSRLLASNLAPEDVAIFVSLSAETKSILESYQIALQRNASIVVITGLKQSLLSTSEKTIYVYTKSRFKDNIDFTSRIPIEYIFERIFDVYFTQEYQ
ncbi:MAG: MurR/RpiR family transcriptional regulator [Culicoidibacterales bacterium]